VQSLCNRCAIAVQSLCNRCAIAVLSLRYLCAITAQSLCNYCAITAQSLRNHCAITVQSLRYHCAITMQSLRYHCAISTGCLGFCPACIRRLRLTKPRTWRFLRMRSKVPLELLSRCSRGALYFPHRDAAEQVMCSGCAVDVQWCFGGVDANVRWLVD
jgi:hypothetical protein